MTQIRWKTAVFALSTGALLLLGACSDSDDDEAATASPAPATTEAPATTVPATSPAESPAATVEGEAADGEMGLAALDGLACTGEWRNETFGSTGSFAATFEVGDDGGNVRLELGGNVFGGQGGTVDAPLTVDGDTTVIDADLGFLGQAMFSFDGTTAMEASLGSPPALGEGSEVTLTDFEFTGEALNATVNIMFADGSEARSVLESTCE